MNKVDRAVFYQRSLLKTSNFCCSATSFLLDHGRRRSRSVEVQEREKCGTEAKPYDPCDLRFDTESKVCGSDNVTYTHTFEMACTASQQKISESLFYESKPKCYIFSIKLLRF